ncbi:BREX-4 system phosphatase PglZ [Thermococcus thermotolerans]|uniref:BREX-4 system phosphatase PglZ n=1 Tax=Thermococcus thermotolerans TaxID=2969672 RepID=UPI0021577306|nr:BREX-4 system phosphatase PglZ [Thermococcus thermotolerans]
MENTLKVNFSELIPLLREEQEHPSYQGYLGGRFPTKIIYTDDYYTYVQIVKGITEKFNPIQVHLSEYCTKRDTLPDIHKAITEIKDELKKGENSLLLTSLSEVIRLNKRKGTKGYHPVHLLSRIHSIEVTPYTQSRLWVVLFGVSSFVQEYWKNSQDTRKVPPIYVPPIFPEEKKKPKICITKDNTVMTLAQDLGKNKILPVTGYREYLSLYESIPSLEMLMSAKILLTGSKILSKYLEKGDFPGIDIEHISTLKDVAEKILSINIPFEYSHDELKFWKELLRELNKLKIPDIVEYLKTTFNIKEFSWTHLLKQWKSSTDYKRWLIFNWMRLNVNLIDNQYLKLVLNNKAINYASFEKSIWVYPLERKLTLNLSEIKERKEVIMLMDLTPPQEFFILLEDTDNPIQKLSVLLGTKKEDKIQIILSVRDAIKRGISLEKTLRILQITFPDLYHYIAFINNPEIPERVQEYFREYILSKVLNEPSDKLLRLQREFNRDNLHTKFKHRNSVISELLSPPIVFIDGLGVEWSGLLKWYLEKHFTNHDIRITFAKASMPTTTEFNKLLGDKTIILTRDLDIVLHSKEYPENIIEEIETIKEIIQNKISKLKGKKFIITSDHGATQFNGYIKDRIKLPSSIQGQHKRDGRYFVITEINSLEDIDNTPEYLVEIKEDKKIYLISRTYKVFPGGKRSITETHGGATPEELIVPVIFVSPLSEAPAKVRVMKKIVRLVKPILEVKIESLYGLNEVILRIDGRDIKGETKTGNLWKFNLRKLKLRPGKYKGTLISGDKKIGEVEFEIRGGLEEEELI